MQLCYVKKMFLAKLAKHAIFCCARVGKGEEGTETKTCDKGL